MALFSGRKNRRQQWSVRLRALSGENAGSAEDLLRRVVEARGNRLLLLDDPGFADVGGACGIWLSMRDIDAVWIDPTSTGAHRDGIICHEIGHMVNGDRPVELGAETLLSVIASGFEHIDPSLVAAALGRTTYEERVERRAEDFGTWASVHLARVRRSDTDRVLAAMRESLGSRIDYW